jgi:L-2,4-diaminobutyrate decarboxylase
LAGFDDPSRLAVVISADAHFSLKHAVRTLGLGETSLVEVPVDKKRRLDAAALETMLPESRYVVSVVATAGTTSTGAVDPVASMADVCGERGVWLHVDGAYGLAYKLVPQWSGLFDGVERADSVSWDPHKQFGVPIPSSILFVRRAEDFGRMALYSSYFNRPDAREPNPGVKSMPSTRPLTALPLVASIRHQGLRGVRERLRAPLDTIRRSSEYLATQSDFELCLEPDTGILCFRVVPEGMPEPELDRLQQSIYERIMAEGRRTISVTQLDGRTVLRLVAISPSVTFEAMKETLAEVRRKAKG